jgi:carboxynorspermidine decarboxylase
MVLKSYQNSVPSPSYVCEEDALRANLALLADIEKQSGAKILVALKGFAFHYAFDLIAEYLSGAAASGLHEAKLASELGKEVHTFCPAIKESEFDEIARLSDHLIFNSFSQWRRFSKQAKSYEHLECGMRINPEVSTVETDIYNPCAPYSRLGVSLEEFKRDELEGISGLHFHALCEQDSRDLEKVLESIESKFGDILPNMRWVNFGGGHHITREGYDVGLLIRLIQKFAKRYDVQVYLEPGEAVGWKTGTLVGEVVDIVRNKIDIAILDISATTHMPDTLEMPYRAEILGAKEPHELPYTYRMTGPSCLAGDVIGDYSFKEPLYIGQRIIFDDMIHYTMVKTTTFNGIKLPSIVWYTKDEGSKIVKEFGYEDFKSRLG